MYCSYCGKEINSSAVFCSHCGKKKIGGEQPTSARIAGVFQMLLEATYKIEKGFFSGANAVNINVIFYIQMTESSANTTKQYDICKCEYRLSKTHSFLYEPYSLDLRAWGTNFKKAYTSVIARIEADGWNLSNIVPQENRLKFDNIFLDINELQKSNGKLLKSLYRFAVNKTN